MIDVREELRQQSRDTGIPQKELKRLCLEAGLALLKTEGIRITKRPRDSKTAPAPADR